VKSEYNQGDVLNVDVSPAYKSSIFQKTYYDCVFSIKLNGESLVSGEPGEECVWGDCFALRNIVLSKLGSNTLVASYVCNEICGGESRYDDKVGCQSGFYSKSESVSFNVVGASSPVPAPSDVVYCFRCVDGSVLSLKSSGSCPSGYGEDESIIDNCRSSEPVVIPSTPPPAPSCKYSVQSVCEDGNFVSGW